jgi:hypothetical protein
VNPSESGSPGTLLGGVVGFLAAGLLEGSRRAHEDAHRFEGERHGLYARFLRTAADAEAVIRERNIAASIIREHSDLADRMTTPDRPDTSAIRLMVEEIQMLAPFSVYSSAVILSTMLDALEDAYDQPDEKWRKASTELQRARSTFVKRAKADLGTPTGVMTRGQELRYRLRNVSTSADLRSRRPRPDECHAVASPMPCYMPEPSRLPGG